MLERPEPATTAIILIDMQEKLTRAMTNIDAVVNRQQLLLRGAGLLGLPVVATEQYPQGLGATIPGLAELLPPGSKVVEKTSFSCFDEPCFTGELAARSYRTLIIAGCEAHVCVQQTVLDALARDHQVILAADAVTSRFQHNIDWALALGRESGAAVMSVEAALFWLLRDATHPEFRALSKLVR